MMGLISQNVIPKDQVEKTKSKANGGHLVAEENEGIDIVRVSSGNRKRKKDGDGMEQEREMKKLENFLFGSLYDPVEFGKDEEEEKTGGSAMFFVDRSTNNDVSVYEDDTGSESSEKEDIRQKKPVWVDEEEEKTNINIAKVNRLRKLRKEEVESEISGSAYVERLRAHHAKLNPGIEWAHLDARGRNYSSDGDDSGEENGALDDRDDILQSNEDVVVKSKKLLPGLLGYTVLADPNAGERSKGPINSVQFHRNGELLLTGGLDKALSFYQIDGKKKLRIERIFVDDCPIKKASFLPDGSQVIIAGRRKFFYSLDIVKGAVNKVGPLVGREEKSLEVFEVSPDSDTIAFLGNDGYILLVSSKTKELIGTLKMNGTVRSLAFANYGQQLLSSGGDGQIYHWDLRTRTCFHKGVDEGCINGTSLCTSPSGHLFAAGSESGIVNIYNREEFLGGKKKPIKTVENLTTKVDFMKFSTDVQILAIGSRMKKNSSKLVHIPSYTVFSNWPPPNRTINYPHCLDFSPRGGYMALGNAEGRVLLYKLHHYNDV